jgi:hypothetical protein
LIDIHFLNLKNDKSEYSVQFQKPLEPYPHGSGRGANYPHFFQRPVAGKGLKVKKIVKYPFKHLISISLKS